MNKFNMDVSKKENGAYVKVGTVDVYYPLLNELGLSVEASKDDADGFPIYDDEKVQFVFDAVWAAVKATARNKLVSGTADLKEGNAIATTVEELLAASGGRSGEALETRRAFLASFKAWLPSLGKPTAFNAGLYDLVNASKNLPYVSDARKKLVDNTVAAFGATLSDELLAKYARLITNISELCNSADPLLDA